MTRIGQIYSLADPREPNTPRYYGQTVKPLGTRLGQHVSAATRGDQKYVARWIRGLLLASIRPLISAVSDGSTREELDRLERIAIERGRAQGFPLCNLTDGGGGAKGYVPTAATRERQSLAARGPRPPRSAATRAKLSAANKGKRATDETRAKLSAALKGKRKRPRTPEHAAKIVAARAGWRPTPEQNTRRTAGLKAWHSVNGWTFSDETRAKMSAAKKGKPLSPEHRAKIGAALRGRTHCA